MSSIVIHMCVAAALASSHAPMAIPSQHRDCVYVVKDASLPAPTWDWVYDAKTNVWSIRTNGGKR